jgi:hypothetical protein
MSESGATARAVPRTATRRHPASRRLRVVSAAAAEPRGGLFATMCVLVLAGGLMAVLALNTALAQGSFELHDLQARSGELADAQEALSQAVDAERAPAEVARRARALGMVPADSPAFLRLSDGTILGVAKAAHRDPDFAVVTAAAPTLAATQASPAPVRTVVNKGDLRITTLVSVRPSGEVVTTVTTVNAKTGTTTTRTTVTPPSERPDTAPTPGAGAPGAEQRSTDAPPADAPTPAGGPTGSPDPTAAPTPEE